jgi:hypothetical protein
MFIQPPPESDTSTSSVAGRSGTSHLSPMGGMAEATRCEALLRVPCPAPHTIEPARRATAWYDRC